MAIAITAAAATPAMPEACKQTELDAEIAYDRLVNHAWQCATCGLWRNQLWAVDRLCPKGAELADRYAVAEARRGRGN